MKRTRSQEFIVQRDFSVMRFSALLIFSSRLKKSSEKCTDPVLWSHYDSEGSEGSLSFVFQCRSEAWLQAEGIMRKRRRRRGDPEPVEDLEVPYLPKREPEEEVVPANRVSSDGPEIIATAGLLPRSLSRRSLSYTDDELGF